MLYVAFFAFIISVLFIDLKLFHTSDVIPTTKQSSRWVAIWVFLAIAFGLILYAWKGSAKSAEYFAGYLIEYSLSADNMFVFLLIFSFFKVPFAYQHRVLFYGILGAMIFRGLFIAVGVAAITKFAWITYVLGAFLIYTAIRIAAGAGEVDPANSRIVRYLNLRLRTTHHFDRNKLITRVEGRRVGTLLLLVLLTIEITDIAFAIDSIPAIFGITKDPFVVVTSNMFAILGLRALYFLIAGSMARFHLLKYGLAFILAFVGAKMLLGLIHFEIPTLISLLIIVFVLGVTVVASLRFPPESSEPGPIGTESS